MGPFQKALVEKLRETPGEAGQPSWWPLPIFSNSPGPAELSKREVGSLVISETDAIAALSGYLIGNREKDLQKAASRLGDVSVAELARLIAGHFEQTLYGNIASLAIRGDLFNRAARRATRTIPIARLRRCGECGSAFFSGTAQKTYCPMGCGATRRKQKEKIRSRKRAVAKTQGRQTRQAEEARLNGQIDELFYEGAKKGRRAGQVGEDHCTRMKRDPRYRAALISMAKLSKDEQLADAIARQR